MNVEVIRWAFYRNLIGASLDYVQRSEAHAFEACYNNEHLYDCGEEQNYLALCMIALGSPLMPNVVLFVFWTSIKHCAVMYVTEKNKYWIYKKRKEKSYKLSYTVTLIKMLTVFCLNGH